MENFRTTLTKEEFDRYDVHYPSNLCIVQMPPEHDITISGIKINFNENVLYAEGEGSHVADCADVFGSVVRTVDRLYYKRNDTKYSMSWQTTVEIQRGDVVWFNHLISKNCCEILVDDTLYKVIPYEDLMVARRDGLSQDERGEQIIPLNGNVILEEVYHKSISEFDILPKEVDMFKGIVRFNGSDNTEYQSKGIADFKGLKEGDLVMLEKNSYPFYLERSKWNSNFDDGKQYLCCQKRHVIAVL
jgi:hypothetical protein